MKNLFILAVLLLQSIIINAQELKPTVEQALIKVKAVDDKDMVQANSEISFIDWVSKKEFTKVTNEKGEFSILLPTSKKYKVKYKAFVDVDTDLELELPLQKTAYMMTYTITVTPSRYFTLDNVNFDTGKSSLRVDSYTALNELVSYLKLKPKLVIEIGGHTDNVGSAINNLKLSQDRANTVRAFLIKNGIQAAHVQAKGYGDTEPVESNETDAGRQQNRRTEVKILSE